MNVLLFSFLGIILAIPFINKYNKNNILFLLFYSFSILLYIYYFYLNKGFHNYNPFFVDEIFYINNYTLKEPFSILVTLINNINIGILFFINSFLFLIVNMKVLELCNDNIFFKQILIILLTFTSYWSIFVLKETLIICILSSFFILNKKGRTLKKIALLLFLLFIRYEFLLIFLMSLLAYKSYSKNKVFFFLLLLLILIAVIGFFSTEESYSFKLSIVSRAEGASNKVFNDEVRNISKQNFLNFIRSNLYLKAIKTNLIESFLPKLNIIFPLYIINLIGLFLFLKNFKEKNLLFFFSFFIYLISILTHSQIRYVFSISYINILNYLINYPLQK